MNNQTNKILGIIFILLGIGYLGDQFQLWSFTIFFAGWWTLFLIIPGVVSMITSGVKSHNVLLTGIGIYLFLWVNDIVRFRFTFQLMIAVMFIYLGVKLITSKQVQYSSTNHRDFSNTKAGSSNSEHLRITSIFANQNYAFNDRIYTCKVDCTCSTLRIDLRHADVSELKALDIDCVGGSVDLYIAKDVNVNVRRDNFLGSCSIPMPIEDKKIDIYIRTSCVLGQIRIIRVDK